MKMQRYESFDEYLVAQASGNQRIVRALRKLVKRVSPHLEESVKWGNGCWVKGKTPIAYVYCGPDHLQFGFFSGSSLDDPEGLLQGAGKFVRHVKLRKASEIDERALAALLRQAAR